MGIKEVIQTLLATFKLPRKPLAPLPPPLLLTGGQLRVGLSPDLIAARIIARQSEAGAPIGPLPDGSENIEEKMIRIIVDELIKALITEGKIEIIIPSGVPITAIGGNAGGPITVVGATISPALGIGVIR